MTNWMRALGVVLAVGALSASGVSQIGRGGGKGGGTTPPPKNQGGGGGGTSNGTGGVKPPKNPPVNQGGGGTGGIKPPKNQGGGSGGSGGNQGGGGGNGIGRGGGSGPKNNPPINQGGSGTGGIKPPRNQGGGSVGGGTQGGGIGRGGGSQGGGVRGGDQGNGSQNGGQGGGITRGGGIEVIPRNTGRGGSPTGRGSANNGNGGYVAGGRPGDIGRVQLPSLNKGSLAQQAGRLNEARPNRGNWGGSNEGYGYGNYNGWRCGYYQYNNRWDDNSFWYSNYAYNPWDNRCTISPWYYYSNLPAYIVVTRIVYVDNARCDWGYGQRYNGDWNIRNSGWGNNNNGGWGNGNDRWDDRDRDRDSVRDAVYDIRNFFERQDRRGMSNLIDRDRVNIYHEGRYSYSVDGEDFYDMLCDAAMATRTTSYDIEDVRHSRDGIQIAARHTFQTPFGGRSSVTHNYRLVETRYGYQITDFNTGYRSAW